MTAWVVRLLNWIDRRLQKQRFIWSFRSLGKSGKDAERHIKLLRDALGNQEERIND